MGSFISQQELYQLENSLNRKHFKKVFTRLIYLLVFIVIIIFFKNYLNE